jgi:hypothetical protein
MAGHTVYLLSLCFLPQNSATPGCGGWPAGGSIKALPEAEPPLQIVFQTA